MIVETTTADGVSGRDGSADRRIPWIDYAKGLCIIMVVMMHTVLGVEKAAGTATWLHAAIDFARPFRMPDFFLLSGLLLSRTIDRDWRSFLDGKVVHFAYFYGLWVLIQWGMKNVYPAIAAGDPSEAVGTLVSALWDPPGALWFIYMLPIFFVATKLMRRAPMVLVLAGAAGLQLISQDTGTMPDEFCERFFFFLVGYYFAPYVFRFAARIVANKPVALTALAGWALVNGTLVAFGIALWPGIGLALGLAGALAVVAVGALLQATGRCFWLRYTGRNSLVVYLAFFVPMAGLRTFALKFGLVPDLALLSIGITMIAVVSPLILQRLVRGTALRFLFERPAWARIAPEPTRPSAGSLVPAE